MSELFPKDSKGTWTPDSWGSVGSRMTVGCRPGKLSKQGESADVITAPNRSPAGNALQEKQNQLPAVSARLIFSQLHLA